MIGQVAAMCLVQQRAFAEAPTHCAVLHRLSCPPRDDPALPDADQGRQHHSAHNRQGHATVTLSQQPICRGQWTSKWST